MVESRTFYITRCDDDQLETGTPPQGYLRRQAKKSRVGKPTTSRLLTGISALSLSRRGKFKRLKNENLTSRRRSPKSKQPLEMRLLDPSATETLTQNLRFLGEREAPTEWPTFDHHSDETCTCR